MGVSDQVTILERDYRAMDGTFDRLVSVGMMEHVGISHFDEFAPRLLARQESLLAEMNPEWHRRWLNDPACHAAFYRRKTQSS